MKTSTPRIKSVKFKNGGFLKALPVERSNYRRVDFGWGEVVYRAYDGKKLTIADCYYMADESKRLLQDENNG